METTKYIWMDGKIVAWEKAKIHVLTHSLHYGAGVFEGIRFYDTKNGPAVFRLNEHLERLLYSARCIDMKIPYSVKDLTKATVELLRKNKIKSGYIRPISFFGYGKMGLNPTGCPVNTVIAAWPWGSYLGERPVKCKISSFIRIHPKSTFSAAKICGHYVNSIFASLEVHKNGYDEAILLDFKGNVAEGPGENIFMVKNGKIYTPGTGNILPGITRDSIRQIAKNHGINYEAKTISKRYLLTADEAFYTGTAAEVTPIASINNIKIGTGKMGKITSIMKNEYLKAVKGELPQYEHWLTYINK